MKQIVKYLVFLVIAVSGCSRIMYMVSARFETLDSATDSLRLRFHFNKESDTTSFAVQTIYVACNGERYCTITTPRPVKDFSYPPKRGECIVVYKEGKDSTAPISKKNSYEFVFQGDDANGYWMYRPEFAERSGRWLFDSAGYFTDPVRVWYDRWAGRDMVYLDFQDSVSFPVDSIKLIDSKDSLVAFDLTADPKHPTLLGLELRHDLDGDEPFTVLFPSSMLRRPGGDPLAFTSQASGGSSFTLLGSKDARALRK